ncbi:sensor histidine kinase [Candidatus Dactylopiibacterium carminicum]|nr:ATP-binding protein [Candidatus Dactylopiibacterium carminicum]
MKVWPWRVGAARILPVAAGAALLVYAWREAPVSASALPWLLLAAVCGVATTKVLAYRRALRRLHEGVALAMDGYLRPVAPADREGYGAEVLRDYNSMISRLDQVFAIVDECQSSVIVERDTIQILQRSFPGLMLGVAADHHVVTTNRQAEHLLGPVGGKQDGRTVFDLLQLDEPVRARLVSALERGERLGNIEICSPVSGRPRWFSLNLEPLPPAAGRDLCALVILQDVTEYRELLESVASRDKLVALGELAGGVAHELNTPLGSILGYAQLAVEAVQDRQGVGGSEEAVRKYVSVIRDEARRCSNIIRNLLDYTRQGRCDEGAGDVLAAIRNALDAHHCRLKQVDARIEFEAGTEPLWVALPEGKLEIVLGNLLLNASQAIEGLPERSIAIQVSASGRGVQVVVEDSGHGVPERLRNRIFDPFFSTKELGSGLGLSIAQSIVARYGGSLGLDLRHEGGARFILRLPAWVGGACHG